MKILITGSEGYLGKILVSLLQKQGHKVTGIDNLLYWQDPSPETKFGDITSIADMYHATQDVDAVVALAAIVGDEACQLDEVGTINVNYEATKLLLEMCELNGVKKLIYASTCSVYGDSSDKIATETAATNPLSLYAKTRLMSEELVMKSRKTVSKVLRFGTLFGYSPRMRFDLVANLMTATAVFDHKVMVKGGDQWRPLLHVEDAAESIAFALRTSAHGIFNVVGENIQIQQIAETVKSLIKDTEIITKNAKDKRDYRVDSSKIKELGMIPRRSLAVGVKEIKQALKKNNINYKDSKFYNVNMLRDI